MLEEILMRRSGNRRETAGVLIDDHVDHAGNKYQRAGHRDCVYVLWSLYDYSYDNKKLLM
jgi:hypothetical protein